MKRERKRRLERIARRRRERREERHVSVKGTLAVSAGGFGFVTLPPQAEGELQEDIFIPPQFIQDALDGDEVRVELLPPREEFSGEKRGPAGKVVEVIRRNRTEFVGRLISSKKIHPLSKKLPEKIELSGSRIGCKKGDWVKVQLLDCDRGIWRGSIRKRLGEAGVVAADLDAIMEEYNIAPRYSEELDREAQGIEPREIPREDHTGEFTLTLDPFDAKDFDDALSVLPGTDENTVVIGIHISDVAAYIAPGSTFDREAARRGFSCYLPGRTLPMLPPALTAKISLQQGQKSLAHSLYLTVEKATGKILQYRRCHSVIRVDHRLDYDEVQHFIDHGPELENWGAGVKESLLLLLETTRALRKFRRENEKFIDLALPEIRVLCDEKNNEIKGLVRKISREAEEIVEECMLAANSIVATELGERAVAGLYRIHPAPEPDKMAEFSENVESVFGIVPGDLTSRSAINDFISKLTNSPGKPFILSMLLRSMPRASYLEKPALHFGLGKGRYSHFTSPIRRYSDLTIHQQLWNLDQNKKLRSSGVMAKIALTCTELEENNDAAYFAASDRLKLRYLAELLDNGGSDFFEGVVAKVTVSGLQVDIWELGIFGFVPREYIRDFRKYKPGCFISLKLDGIDFTRGTAYFVPADRKGI